jgi:hypothetical protein
MSTIEKLPRNTNGNDFAGVRELKTEELENVSGGVTALDVNRSSWDTFGDIQTRLVVSGKGD